MKQKLLALLCLITLNLNSQEIAKNILVEHFTNSFCSVCANRNPSLYNTIENYEKVVHLAYHPSSPYLSCPFSMHNMSENDARTNYYNIFGGTPRVVVNGTVVPTGATLLSPNILDAANNLTSPFQIAVNQFQVGSDSMYSTITISTLSNTSIVTANLFIALSEQTLNFAAQNGENVHQDVFRKFLGGSNGISINLPANGNDTTLYFGSIIDQEWVATQITTTAILQSTSKEVYQAAQSEKLDFNTSVSLVKMLDKVLYPNPAKDYIYINNELLLIDKIEIYNIIGSLIYQDDLKGKKTLKIAVSSFNEGNYLVRIHDNNKTVYTKKIVVDF